MLHLLALPAMTGATGRFDEGGKLSTINVVQQSFHTSRTQQMA
jgi:hypothetical protein